MDFKKDYDEFYEIFDEINGEFTVFIVEQRFAVNRGQQYFQQYHGTPNFISSNYEAE